MKTVLRKKNCVRGIPTCLLLCIVFLVLGSLPLMAGDSTTLGSPGGTLTGYTSKNVSAGSNYVIYPTPGTYSWTVPDDVASKVWVTLAAGGSGGTGPCWGSESPSCVNNLGSGGAVGGFVNRQEVTVVPGAVATIVVGSGGPAGGACGWSYAYSNSSGQTLGGNTCFYNGSGGSVCATGGAAYWNQPYCSASVVSGGPVAAGGAGGAVNGAGTGGYARIDW